MRFLPAKQLNAIIRQEYFEPTISWALRVVIALNVPLLLLPLKTGFKAEIVWMSFTAYLLSLLDFRGPHYQKVFIQVIESVLLILAAIAGMNVSGNLVLSVVCMFAIGMFAALIRNWSDYGAAIGVATGFFYLFGLANPVSFSISVHFGEWILAGAAWALFITLVSFPFQVFNPLKRSVAAIWKQNTELLDVIISENLSTSANLSLIVEKEVAVRAAINKSIELFKKRSGTTAKISARHYDIIIELRKTSSLFGAAVTSLQQELSALNTTTFDPIRSSIIYKTLSAFGQASAQIAIVIFTDRKEDMKIAKIRVKRCSIATKILKDSGSALPMSEGETQSFSHFIYTLNVACEYLERGIHLLEEKKSLTKSIHVEEYKLTFNNLLSGLNPYEWLPNMRTVFNVNSQQFRYALRVAIAVSTGVFIFIFFHINHGYWIPLTILIVIQPYYGATLKKGMERVLGTAAGVIAGGLINLLTLPHYVFVFLLVIISFLVVYNIRHNYKVGVFFLTLMMVVLLHLSSIASWQLIGWRLLSTLIGSLLAVIAGYAFWPVWEQELFPKLMSQALLQNKKYISQVLLNLQPETFSDRWIRQRNLAEAANSDVFASVQRMNDEPGYIKERNDYNFDIVGINIRITREITSIALSISTAPGKEELELPSTSTQNFLELFDVLNDMIIKKTNEQLPPPDFQKANAMLITRTGLSERSLFIKTELEKIIFELETMYASIKN